MIYIFYYLPRHKRARDHREPGNVLSRRSLLSPAAATAVEGRHQERGGTAASASAALVVRGRGGGPAAEAAPFSRGALLALGGLLMAASLPVGEIKVGEPRVGLVDEQQDRDVEVHPKRER